MREAFLCFFINKSSIRTLLLVASDGFLMYPYVWTRWQSLLIGDRLDNALENGIQVNVILVGLNSIT